MNLFFLHQDPRIAASLQADVHVIKMIVETLQMICTALRLSYSPFVWPFDLYKETHTNHPSTKWIRSNIANYSWALQHGIALCKEYTKRYDKIHKCQQYYDHISNMPLPYFNGVHVGDFDQNKIAFKSLPLNCNFAAIAIADDIFSQCSEFDAEGNLLAVETYVSYYTYKMKNMKRKMRWNRCDTPPIELSQMIEQTRKRKYDSEIADDMKKYKTRNEEVIPTWSFGYDLVHPCNRQFWY